MPKLNTDGLNLIKKLEGRIIDKNTGLHRAYGDPYYWTIGYGTLMTLWNGNPASPRQNTLYAGQRLLYVPFGTLPSNWQYITEEQANALLNKELSYFTDRLPNYLDVELGDNQFSALVSFCYNCGLGTFQRSRLRTIINTNPTDYSSIEYAFGRYSRCNGQYMAGLAKRRQAEFNLYSKPQDGDYSPIPNSSVAANNVFTAFMQYVRSFKN